MNTVMLTLTHFINIVHSEIVMLDILHELKKTGRKSLYKSVSDSIITISSLCIFCVLQSVHFTT
jgi:hypothetical protein